MRSQATVDKVSLTLRTSYQMGPTIKYRDPATCEGGQGNSEKTNFIDRENGNILVLGDGEVIAPNCNYSNSTKSLFDLNNIFQNQATEKGRQIGDILDKNNLPLFVKNNITTQKIIVI